MDDVPIRLLFVDDDRSTRHLMRRGLEHRGIAVVTEAATAEQAWRTFQREQFDLVVADQMMPGGTGSDLLGWIREWERNTGRSPVPFFICSAGEPDVPGATALIRKPIDLQHLVDSMVSAVRLSKSSRSPPRDAGDQTG